MVRSLSIVEKVDILTLEGYAINGFVTEFKIVDCSVGGRVRTAKITATLNDNRYVETECLEYSRISRVYVLLEKYKDLKGVIISDKEVMSGVTYDSERE